MQIPVALERLVFEFSRFPGVGRKTAQRLAFNILRYTTEETQNLSEALIQVKEQIRYCSVCSGFTDIDPCVICSHSTRDQQQVCVVEQPNNIFPIEKSGIFKGVYHVLMGAISPLDSIGPEQLNVKKLRNIALSIGNIFYFIFRAEIEHENLKRITYGKRYDLSIDKIKEMLLI